MTAQPNLSLSDHDNYVEMSRPFETAEEADAAIKAFWDEFYELRNKHRLADVSVIVKDSIKGSGVFMWDCHAGSEMEQESMAAWHMGMSSANRQRMIREAIEIGSRSAVHVGKNKL